jgi:choline dehydrogenase-like flavoprotein
LTGEFGANLGTKYDYNYTTEANSETGVGALGWPRGRVVGGSSALNFLVWDAASEQEYDAWEELGNPGWNWKMMDKFMRKAENFTAPSARVEDLLDTEVVESNYGSNGPTQVSFTRYVSKQVQNWIPALKTLGIAGNDEPLAGKNVGASVQPANINARNSTRSYSAPAYYYPNQGRKNLALLPNAVVQHLNWATSGKAKSNLKTASGVTFENGGKYYNVTAKKEVIISGGAVNSPQILELSGVGKKSVLKAAGITQVIENDNVGENLQDHTYSYVTLKVANGTTTLDSLKWNTTFASEQAALYAAGKVSILDETVPSIAYISAKTLLGNKTEAAIKKAVSYVKTVSAPYKATLQKQLDFLQKYPDTISQMELIGVDGYFAGVASGFEAGSNYITFLSASQHLLARGSVHINSKNPSVQPTIQPNYYNNDFDATVAVEAIRMLRKIGNTKEYSYANGGEVVPGSDVQTDAQILAFLKGTGGTTTEYHPCASVSMLPANKGGVVSPKLLVYGTENVRVIDASIIPLHVSAHIQRTTLGVAEFGAKLVLDDA